MPGARIDGVELDAAALSRARCRCPNVSLVQGDVCGLPVRSGAYDLVLCLEVLEHLDEPRRAIRELRRVTRGGCLLSVPHEPYFRLGNLLRGRHLRHLGNPEDHVQHWGAPGFRALCAEHLTLRRTARPFPWLVVLGGV
jgi:SAM-dependent methyltransferase